MKKIWFQAVMAGCMLVGVTGAVWGAALDLSRRTLDWDQDVFLECEISGLAPGAEGVLTLYVDVNQNGVADGGDFPLASFPVADGEAAPWGSVTWVADSDGATNGIIDAHISYYGVAESFIHTAGDYVWAYSGQGGDAAAPFTVLLDEADSWITGQVRIMGTETAVPGARVSLLLFPGTEGYAPSVWTDELGAFRLDVPPGISNTSVRGVMASAPGYLAAMQGSDEMGFLSGYLFTNAPAAGDNPLPAPLVVVTEEPAHEVFRINGRVLAENGATPVALPHAIVVCDPDEDRDELDPLIAWDISNADGDFTLILPGDMGGFAFAGDNLLAMRGRVATGADLPPDRTEAVTLPAFVCPPATAMALCTVRRDDGEPLPGAYMNMGGEEFGGFAYAFPANVTQTVCEIFLTSGLTYETEADTAYLNAMGLLDMDDPDDIEIGPGLNTGIELVLRRGIPLQGRVTDAETGQPLSGGMVGTSGGDGGTRALADHDGRYTLRLTSGVYTVSVNADNLPGYLPAYSNDVALPPQGLTGVDFALEKAVYISGQVTTPGTDPRLVRVEAHEITDQSEFHRVWYYVNGVDADTNGFFSIPLPPGTNYMISARPRAETFLAPQYYDGRYNRMAADIVSVSQESQPTNINFNLTTGMRLQGQVTDELDQPMQAAWVSAEYRSGEEWKWHDGTGVDSNGMFSLILPTNYPVILSAQANQPYGMMYLGQTINRDSTPLLWTNASETISGLDIQLFHVGRVDGRVSPDEARMDGAQWRLTHGVDTNWNYPHHILNNIPVGVYTCAFSDVQGWITPSNQAITVLENQSAQPEGVYTRDMGIQVFLWPEEIQSTAFWRLVEGPDTSWQQHGDLVAPLTAGTYTINFSTLAGWNSPADIEVVLEAGQFVQTNAFYQEHRGMIFCDLLPGGAVTDGARWRITGQHAPTNWMTSGDGEHVRLGVYTLEFHQVTGWLAPDAFPVEVLVENQEIRTQSVYTCHYTITPTNAQFGMSPATGTIEVVAGSGCAWTAEVTTGTNWVSIFEGEVGLGTGTVRFAVSENIQPASREATMLVAGRGFTVQQEAYTCDYVRVPTNAAFDHFAATGTVALAAGPACPWTAVVTTGTNWVTILTGASGTGTGTVSFAVNENRRSAPRQALVRIADEDFLIDQEGNPDSILPMGIMQMLLLDR